MSFIAYSSKEMSLEITSATFTHYCLHLLLLSSCTTYQWRELGGEIYLPEVLPPVERRAFGRPRKLSFSFIATYKGIVLQTTPWLASKI